MPEIKRQVIEEEGFNSKIKKVEIYLLEFYIMKTKKDSKKNEIDEFSKTKLELSKKANLSIIFFDYCERWNLNPEKTELFVDDDSTPLPTTDLTLDDAKVFSGSCVLFKPKKKLSFFQKLFQKKVSKPNKTNSVNSLEKENQKKPNQNQSSSDTQLDNPQIRKEGEEDDKKEEEGGGEKEDGEKNGENVMVERVDWRKIKNSIKNKEGGRVGLINIGNTCFMNSALQSLSNLFPFTNYFLSGSYEKEINKKNKLGTAGKLSKEYHSILENLWMGKDAFRPKSFKALISKIAPQFEGYQQHDAQELLMYLLDGLHEDLNRVVVKKYVESVDQELSTFLLHFHFFIKFSKKKKKKKKKKK